MTVEYENLTLLKIERLISRFGKPSLKLIPIDWRDIPCVISFDTEAERDKEFIRLAELLFSDITRTDNSDIQLY